MSQSPGKQFENDIKDSIPDRCDYTRLKDAGGWSRSETMRFSSSNPCDMIIFSRAKNSFASSDMYKLELKSLLGKSLPFGNIKPKEKARMKFINNLVASEEKGVIAGFIVNFRDLTETFFVKASAVKAFIVTTDRKSIPIVWFRENGRLIKQTLKKVHYRYELDWL